MRAYPVNPSVDELLVKKMEKNPHADPDQHFYMVSSCSCLPCLVDVRYCDRELSCLQREWQTAKMKT